MLARYPQLKIDILKVGHHGSKTSSTKRFIKQLNPREALISAGLNNRFKHPHQETLATLEEQNKLLSDRSSRNDLLSMVTLARAF